MSATGLASRSCGSHVCWVVDDDAGYRERAATLLDDGKAAGQKTAVFGPSTSAALAELRSAAAIVADPYVDFLERGPLEPERMFAMFCEQSARARDEGYDGVRVVADMDWLLPAWPSRSAIIEFELLLDRVVSELDATVLCAYRRSSFDDSAIDGVLCVHPQWTGHRDEPPFCLVARDPHTWELCGEVDATVLPEFTSVLATATMQGPRVIDAAGLEFIDVAGMRAIARTARAADATIELRRTRTSLRRYWRLAGFDEFAPAVKLS
jgi:anti-anti-sigma regulatory factor